MTCARVISLNRARFDERCVDDISVLTPWSNRLEDGAGGFEGAGGFAKFEAEGGFEGAGDFNKFTEGGEFVDSVQGRTSLRLEPSDVLVTPAVVAMEAPLAREAESDTPTFVTDGFESASPELGCLDDVSE